MFVPGRFSVVRTFAGIALLAAPLTAQAQWQEPGTISLLEKVGDQQDSLFGFLVEGLGDVNGDGIADFAATSPFFDGPQFGQASWGRVSVHSGADGSFIWSKTGSIQSEIHGFALSTMDDLTGDGIMEVVAGGGWNSGAVGGRVVIYNGATGEVVQSWTGPVQFDTYGHSVATRGDFNGDGTADIAFSAPGVDTHGTNAGEVRVYSTDGFSLICVIGPPNAQDGRLGNGLEFIGDVNGDGRDDLAIGARLGVNWDPPGSIHVFGFDGADPQLIYSISDVNHGGAFDGDLIESGFDYNDDGINDILFGQWSLNEAPLFSGADGKLIHTFTGDGTDEAFGTGQMIPDITGDGHPDLIMSGWVNDSGAMTGGKVYFYSGSDFSLIRTMTHTRVGGKFGTGISTIGDYNKDGALDFLIGAPGTSFEDLPLGRVFIMAGTPVDGPETADLVSFSFTFGTQLGGNLNSLINSDGNELSGRSAFGFSVLEPSLLQIITVHDTDVPNPDTLSVTIETRINHPVGTATVRLRNWNTNAFQIMGTFGLGFAEVSETLDGIDASIFSRAADGRIEVSTRQVVLAVFSALGFDGWFDLVEVSVQE